MRPGNKITSFARQEVTQLFNHARLKVKTPGLRILRAPKTLEGARILIVTPRKVGSAPERNLIRRRIKAIFKEHRLYLKEYDLVALIGPECKKYSHQELIRFVLLAYS